MSADSKEATKRVLAFMDAMHGLVHPSNTPLVTREIVFKLAVALAKARDGVSGVKATDREQKLLSDLIDYVIVKRMSNAERVRFAAELMGAIRADYDA